MKNPALPKSTIRILFALAVLLLIVPACRQVQGTVLNTRQSLAPATLEARLEPEEATVGDRVTYTVLLSRMPEIKAAFPVLGPAPDGLTLIDSGHSGPGSEGGRIIETRWATYRVDSVGTKVFPALKTQYQQNGADNELASQSINLQVKSVLSRDMTDIRGLKPLELPKRNLRIFFAIAALLILSGVAAWFWWKKRTKQEILQPVISPDSEAEQKLRELEAMGLIAKGDFRKYYFLLSEIFRKYLERRFEFAAVERTTEEILASLDALRTTESHKNEVRLFLRNTDPVKFAGARCSSAEALEETDRIRRFVAEIRQQTPHTTEERTHVAV